MPLVCLLQETYLRTPGEGSPLGDSPHLRRHVVLYSEKGLLEIKVEVGPYFWGNSATVSLDLGWWDEFLALETQPNG